MAANAAAGWRLALVGADSLAGRELRDLLASGRLAERVDLLADVEPPPGGPDILAEEEAAESSLRPLTAEALAQAGVIFLAGSAASSRRVLELAPQTAKLIDLGGTLGGTLRAPAAEPERYLPPESAVISMAHPAAILLGAFLRRLPRIPERVVAQVLQPASEWGRAGVATLQEQTVNLLNFRPVDKRAFDEQISFNLLPRFGAESPQRLEQLGDRVRHDLTRLLMLEPQIPMPSLFFIQAPVFHGCAAAIWVEFDQPPELPALIESLRPHADLRLGTEEPPSNVSIAGQSGYSLDEPRPDQHNPRAVWFWLMADNLRLAADNALLTAAAILEQAARRVQ